MRNGLGDGGDGLHTWIFAEGGRSAVEASPRMMRRSGAKPLAWQNTNALAATIPAYVSLDDPATAHGLDQAPVQVEITTDGVERALSVPLPRSSGSPAVGSRSRSCAMAGNAS